MITWDTEPAVLNVLPPGTKLHDPLDTPAVHDGWTYTKGEDGLWYAPKSTYGQGLSSAEFIRDMGQFGTYRVMGDK